MHVSNLFNGKSFLLQLFLPTCLDVFGAMNFLIPSVERLQAWENGRLRKIATLSVCQLPLL